MRLPGSFKIIRKRQLSLPEIPVKYARSSAAELYTYFIGDNLVELRKVVRAFAEGKKLPAIQAAKRLSALSGRKISWLNLIISQLFLLFLSRSQTVISRVDAVCVPLFRLK